MHIIITLLYYNFEIDRDDGISQGGRQGFMYQLKQNRTTELGKINGGMCRRFFLEKSKAQSCPKAR